MKTRHPPETRSLTASPANCSMVQLDNINTSAAGRRGVGMMALVLVLLLLATSSWAQVLRFRVPQYRVTVPINSTNTTVVTNVVTLNGVTNATFTISGLPAGAGAYLTDTNSAIVTSVVTSVDGDTNLWLVVNATNIAQGIYTFSLNASGFDTNGAPITNNMFLLLQAAYIWNGSNGALDVSNAWSQASSWLGGLPGAGSDVVFSDIGAQTNAAGFTNSFVDVDTTIGSLRFSHTGITNSFATNASARTHSIQINAGRTLTITGTNGFSFLRDYVDNYQNLGVTDVNIIGQPGSRLVISNASANFAMIVGRSAQAHPTLNAATVDRSVIYVNRLGLGEYQLFPNYRHYNDAHNYGGRPGQFALNYFMPRTNIVTALYKDADGYSNEVTRAYAMTFLDGEVLGVGSDAANNLYLGQSNAFFLDGVCFIRANHSTGNTGAARFNPDFPDGVAVFRGTNNGRMSIFAVSDDGGTNFGEGNVKAIINFASGNGFVDVLADKLIVARDRSMVASNHTVNVTGDLTIGRGIVDVNTAILGFQEAASKTNWYAMDPSLPDNAYLGYCRGNMFVTNGGTVRINRTLTLGYTADTNTVAAAQQYNTYGQLTVYSNSTVMVSNVVVDGGLNYYDSNGRQNRITLNQGGIMVLTNSIGAPPNLPLDLLSMTSSTLQMFVNASRTNVFVRNLQNLGSTPSTIKVLSLTGVTTYPTNIPLISYETAAPFLTADMSLIGGGIQGYIINNTDNKTIDLFLTTNAPKNLVWRGNFDNVWDLTTKNWGLAGGGPDTNFAMGDIATFNDTSLVTNIDIAVVVVPNQTSGTNGVSVTNTIHDYTFNPAGGAIAGTAQIVKTGGGKLTFNAAESGPMNILAGTLDGSGILGATTVASNAMLNFSGTINNGLTSTGTVVLTSSGAMNGGALQIRGGTLENSGFISTVVANNSVIISGGAVVSNTVSGQIDIDTGGNGNNWVVQGGSTLANYGLIRHIRGRINLGPSGLPGALLYGTGTIRDPDGGSLTGGPIDGRVAINQNAIFSPGDAPANSIGTFHADARLDLNNVPATGFGTLLIEVDFSNSQINDKVACDRWNNITGMLLMTNINPSAGSFGNGQTFEIFQNNNSISNNIDVNGTYPIMWPPIPAPGLQWGMLSFRNFGLLNITNSPLIWNGTGAGNWDSNITNTPWQGPLAYFDNAGAVFDDSAGGTTVVTLTGTNAPAGYALQTNIVPNVSTNVTAFGPAMSPGIIVNNPTKDYVFTGNGKITGITGLYKAGSGTLTILTTNDFAGNTYLTGGTVVITNANGLGIVGANNSEYFIDGSTLKYIGTVNATLPRVCVIYPNNATMEVASSTNELTAASIQGAGALIKTGPGTLVLNSDSTYAGGTTISNGTLRLNNTSSTATRVGTNTMTLAGGTLLFSAGPFTITNAIRVVGTGSTIINTNTYVSSGSWSGGGPLTISNTSVFSLSGSITGYSGAITLGTNVGNLRFNDRTNSSNCIGSPTATFNLGAGSGSLSNFNGAGLTYSLGALSGGANTILSGRCSNTTAWAASSIYAIGANGQSTVFAGRISDGADTVSVVKVGAGTLALNGTNTYTGNTTVSNGTLAGNGIISGPVIVTAAATLAPGTSVGKLTVNNSVTLNGTTLMELDRIAGVSTNDQLAANSVTAGGALVVTNIGPGIFNGATFKLFSVPVAGFSSLILPTNGPSGTYVWNNTLSSDGRITLVSGGSVNTNRPTITNTPSGGGTTLTLAWPSSHLGWSLQAQTNTLGTNWFTISGSQTNTSMQFNVDPANSAVFYRLVYP